MWHQIKADTLHLLYLAIGGFLCLFMLFSAFIKNRLHFGEANIALLVGAILGPFAAKAVNPNVWSNFDIVVLEFSRIVIIIQCFVVALELPKFYIEKHWRSLLWLVGPVVVWGWMVCTLLVWLMAPHLSFIQSMTIASCFNAIDPVMAATIVAKTGFGQRVPKHIRDLLLAESASNDVTTSVCLGLSILLTRFPGTARDMTHSLFIYTIIYQIFLAGAVGLVVGWAAQKALHYSFEHDSTDRESFLVFYLMVSLFCVGLGSVLGIDDVLLAFCAGYSFDKRKWWLEKTEESHVSEANNLLLNLTYFVFLGSVIPWSSFNKPDLGISAWRLVVGALLMFLLRRIPVILILKPVIPDIKTWREAFFYGHFGPVGVGAIFSAALISSEPGRTGIAGNLLKPSPDDPMQKSLWPIVTFLVLCSSIVHGSSIPLFRLGKRINTISLTMSYTAGNEEGPSWIDRLPKITAPSSSGRKMSLDNHDIPPGSLPPIGIPGALLRRQRDGDTPSHSSSRITRERRTGWKHMDPIERAPPPKSVPKQQRGPVLAYQLGNTIIVEDEDGEVVKKYELPSPSHGASGRKQDTNLSPKSILKTSNSPWFGRNKEPKIDDTASENQVDEQASDEDGRIRFTIGGTGRRMNKDDFIRTIGGLDPKARRETLDPQEEGSRQGEIRRAAEEASEISVSQAQKQNETPISSRDYPETEVEKRRRLAVLGGLEAPGADIEDSVAPDDRETAVEKRRRLAALGIIESSDTSEDESEIFDPPGPWASGGLGGDFADGDSEHGDAVKCITQHADSMDLVASDLEVGSGGPRIVVSPPEDEVGEEIVMILRGENSLENENDAPERDGAKKDKGKSRARFEN